MVAGSAQPRFPLAFSALVLAFVSGAGCLAALGVVAFAGWTGQFAPALGGWAVCLVGSLITLIPLQRAADHAPSQLPVAAMSTMAIRLGVAFIGATLLIRLAGLAFTPVALWTLGWYLLLLVLEVWIVVGYFQRVHPAG